MSSRLRDSFLPNAAGVAALGTAVLVWRLGRALAAIARLPHVRSDLTAMTGAFTFMDVAPDPLPDESVEVHPIVPPQLSDEVFTAPDLPAPVAPRPKPLPTLELVESEPTPHPAGLNAMPANVADALASALASLETAVAVHGQAASVQQAGRLLISTLLDSPTADAGSIARTATVASFKSAELAASELDLQLATVLAEAREGLAELQTLLAQGSIRDEARSPEAIIAEPRTIETVDDSVQEPIEASGEALEEQTLSAAPAPRLDPEPEAVPVGAETYASDAGTLGVVEQAAEVVTSMEANEGPLASTASSSRLDLQVSKFSNFADLNGYREALATIPGVRDVKIRRVHKGVLFLSVDYEGIVPLTERLQDIREHPARRVTMSGDTIQVALTDEDVE